MRPRDTREGELAYFPALIHHARERHSLHLRASEPNGTVSTMFAYLIVN